MRRPRAVSHTPSTDKRRGTAQCKDWPGHHALCLPVRLPALHRRRRIRPSPKRGNEPVGSLSGRTGRCSLSLPQDGAAKPLKDPRPLAQMGRGRGHSPGSPSASGLRRPPRARRSGSLWTRLGISLPVRRLPPAGPTHRWRPPCHPTLASQRWGTSPGQSVVPFLCPG